MTPVELLVTARAAGIRLEVQGDRLVYRAPKGALTPELRDQLVRNKPALLNLLAQPVEFVTLKGGLIVAVPALRLALDLEDRGCQLAVDDPTGEVVVTPAARLTDEDRAAVHRWRFHLAAIVDYRAPVE